MFDLMPFERGNKSLFRFFDDFEKNFFGDFSGEALSFRTDIIDKGDRYLLDAELPGFDKQDIKIDISDNLLTISAQHKEEKEDKKENYIRKERRWGSFARSFDVSNIDTGKISAKYEGGVLTLDLPKKETLPPQNKQIAIE